MAASARWCFEHNAGWDSHTRDDACCDALDLGAQHDVNEMYRVEMDDRELKYRRAWANAIAAMRSS
jgi:hypothetical protein